MSDRPNILMITLHDLGDYLGCYGTPVATPNIDRLAGQGVRFANHFSTGTVCSPARGSIVTGCYPHTHGLMGLVHRGWCLDVDACPPMPALLREDGYQTHLFGFQHEHWDPSALGYDRCHATDDFFVEKVTPPIVEWLLSPESKGRPFLAAMGAAEVHRMGSPDFGFERATYTPTDPRSVEVRPYMPDIPEIRHDLAHFYGAIQFTDQKVGEVLRTLDETGLAENTIVLFVTDHGASFPHSKATLYDGGTRVAAILRAPGLLPEGEVLQALSSHVDILPTLFDLADVPTPEHVQGRSLVPAIRTRAATREYVFAERNYTNDYDPARMVRSDRHKYIRKGLRTAIFDFQIPEIDQFPGSWRKSEATRAFYPQKRAMENLYDLERDPAELHNVIDDPEYAAVLERMSGALDAHLEETDDAFRRIRAGLLMPEDGYVQQITGQGYGAGEGDVGLSENR